MHLGPASVLIRNPSWSATRAPTPSTHMGPDPVSAAYRKSSAVPQWWVTRDLLPSSRMRVVLAWTRARIPFVALQPAVKDLHMAIGLASARIPLAAIHSA